MRNDHGERSKSGTRVVKIHEFFFAKKSFCCNNIETSFVKRNAAECLKFREQKRDFRKRLPTLIFCWMISATLKQLDYIYFIARWWFDKDRCRTCCSGHCWVFYGFYYSKNANEGRIWSIR